MKTFWHFWRYLAKFLDWEIFQTKVIEKIKTHILYSTTFFRKLHRLWDNVEKFNGDGGTTNDVTIRRICVACWVSKATCTYAHAHAHAPGYLHTCTHVCTHTPITNTYCFSTATLIRERSSILRHTYVACPVINTLPVLSLVKVWRKSVNIIVRWLWHEEGHKWNLSHTCWVAFTSF